VEDPCRVNYNTDFPGRTFEEGLKSGGFEREARDVSIATAITGGFLTMATS